MGESELMTSGRVPSKSMLLLSAVAALACAAVLFLISSHDSPDPRETAGSGEGSKSPHFELPPQETARLWELEHRSNILSRYGFTRLKAGLSENNSPALLVLLADDFSGSVFTAETSTVFQSPDVFK